MPNQYNTLDRSVTSALQQLSMKERVVREGLMWGSNNNYSGTPAAGVVSLSGTSLPPVGQACFVDTLTLGVSRACDIRVQINQRQSVAQSLGNGDIALLIPAAGTLQLPINQIYPGGAAFSVRLENETGSTPLQFRLGVSGWRFADDLRFDNDRVMMMVGDSIQATGPVSSAYRNALAIWQARDYIDTLGKDFRVVMKQIGGCTSSTAELWRNNGNLDVPNASLICYQMGVNDASVALSQATYEANWTSFYNWARRRFPTAKILFLGATPVENNTVETALVALRSNMASWVAARNDANLKYLNLGASFDRTLTANYATTDTPGSRVHPSEVANTAIFNNSWKPFIDANLDWL